MDFKRWINFLIFTPLATISAAVGAQSVSFAGQQSFPAGISPFAIAAADLNCDGRRDLVLALDTASFSVLLNTTTDGSATASFTSAQTFPTSAMFVNGIAVGDINGDGRADILTVNGFDRSISVFLGGTMCGDASASFATEQTFLLSDHPGGLALVDVNGDGKADIVVSGGSDNAISVLMNATAPGASTLAFLPQQDFPAGADPGSVAIADVNGDDKPDAIFVSPNSNTVSVLLNFTPPGASQAVFGTFHSFAVGNLPTSVAVSDVNDDGKPDLLVSNGLDNSVSVLLNTTATGVAAPSFGAQTTLLTGLDPSPAAVADVNGDGKPDLIVAAYGADFVGVLLNTTGEGAATASFADQQIFSVGSTPYSVIATDVNDDGRPDIVAANYSDDSVSILINATKPWEAIFKDGFDVR